MLEEAIPSLLASVHSWFTPTVLFVLLNLVIGTIAVTSSKSSSSSPQHPDAAAGIGDDGRRRLTRAPSALLDRLRSFQLPHPHLLSGDAPLVAADAFPPPPATAHETPHSSGILERLRSFGASRPLASEIPPLLTTHDTSSPPPPPTHEASSLPPPATHEAYSLPPPATHEAYSPPPPASHVAYSPPPRASVETHYVPRSQDPPPEPLGRSPSTVLERLRSFTLCRLRSGEIQAETVAIPPPPEPVDAFLDHPPPPPPLPPVTIAGDDEDDHHLHHLGRSSSDPRPAPDGRLAARMKKSASDKSAFAHFEAEAEAEAEVERRRPATTRAGGRAAVEEDEGGEVDARADDFINRFRQQLKLQRMNSLMRYKEMLNRGN